MGRKHILIILAASIVLLAILWAYPAYRSPPIPQARLRLDDQDTWTELADTRLVPRVFEDAAAARRTFGFDIRRAGLLPVRVEIENRGAHPVRLNPPQTFLVDRQGLAWPLLIAGQARDRLAEALGEKKASGGIPAASLWIAEAPVLTEFAMEVAVKPGSDAAPPGSWQDWLGRLLGEARESLENRSRRALLTRFLRNPAVPAGESAVGYLFFPGREDEVREAESLRLAVEQNGRVQVARIALAPAPRPEDQSRPMAR